MFCCGGGGGGSCGEIVTEWTSNEVNPGVPGGAVGFSSVSARVTYCDTASGSTETPVCNGDFLQCTLLGHGWDPKNGYQIQAWINWQTVAYPGLGGGTSYTIGCRTNFYASGASPYNWCYGA